MKKGIVYFILIVFVVFLGANSVLGYSLLGKVFGGRIINTKAKEIAILEAAGYLCPVIGQTISVLPLGSPFGTPTDFFIPFYVTPKTGDNPFPGKLIIGRYSGQTSITCTLPTTPPQIQIVVLDDITYFGTSKLIK